MSTDTESMIREAQQKVATILSELESNTGMVIDRLELHDIEVTTMGDDRPKWLRSVRIEMKRLPGTYWDK